MVNIKRTSAPPACLEEERKKKFGDYRCGEVIALLVKDFLNKCYLCEYKAPQTLNVEHFLPHRGDRDLKFDWSNLFLACGHCNNLKSDKYTDILNCTDPAEDVENWIKYEMKPYPKEKVIIKAPREQTQRVLNTVKLLDEIYNGTTVLKMTEAVNIRKELLKEILFFQKLLDDFFQDDRHLWPGSS